MRLRLPLPCLLTMLAALCPAWAAAQTDYYNTDAGRPLIIEDAYPVEYRGLELQVAPLRVERSSGGAYHWSIEPEVAFGILPRTQLEVGVPIVFLDGGTGSRGATGLGGVHLSLLHNLNVETTIPALAAAGELLIPAGGFGPDRVYGTAKGIATKTFRWARFHVNGSYTFGSEPQAGEAGVEEVARWLAGMSVDRTFPLKSALVGVEVVARQPIHAEEVVEWLVGAGARYQLDPRWALDGGIGYVFTGSERPWSLTLGGAYALGLPWRRR
jgi:hypothetical protein